MRFVIDQKLPNSKNNLYYYIENDILYLSNTDQTIKQLTNINIKKLFENDILYNILFGEDTKLILSIINSFENITCLIDT